MHGPIGQVLNIIIVFNGDAAAISRDDAGNHVKAGGFACAVRA